MMDCHPALPLAQESGHALQPAPAQGAVDAHPAHGPVTARLPVPKQRRLQGLEAQDPAVHGPAMGQHRSRGLVEPDGDVLAPDETVAAAGTLVTVSSLGSAAGPLVAMTAIAVIGSPVVPFVFAISGGSLAGFAAWQLHKSAMIEPHGHYVPLGARTTPVGTAVLADEIVGAREAITTDA